MKWKVLTKLKRSIDGEGEEGETELTKEIKRKEEKNKKMLAKEELKRNQK